jgi:intracellular sulfur oxidation DsrE/DsrF family protein
MPKPMLAAAILLGMTATSALAAPGSGPAVPGYGATHTAGNAAERPDPKLRYRVVFSISKAAAKPEQVNPSLDKVARYLNLLAEGGVRPQAGDVVAVLHGPATAAATTDAAYAGRTGSAANPNGRLIETLRAAGVTVSVCSQALHGQGIKSGDLQDGIRIDVSAMTTITNLQLRGFALVPD